MFVCIYAYPTISHYIPLPDLIHYEDKLKLLSLSIYCWEEVTYLIPDEDKLWANVWVGATMFLFFF